MASYRYIVHTSAEKTMTIVETPTAPSTAPPRSPWHSPVPYLFGGLAAMLGLIAFALLILACSYWRLSGYLEGGANNDRDLEAGTDSNGDESDTTAGNLQKKLSPVLPQFLVIMPGQEKPTCLATPMSSRASSFGSSCSSSSSSCGSTDDATEKLSPDEEKKQGFIINNGTTVGSTNTVTHMIQQQEMSGVEIGHHDRAADHDGDDDGGQVQ